MTDTYDQTMIEEVVRNRLQLQKVTQVELERQLSELSGIEINSELMPLLRMNIIGSLRAQGHIIPRTRGVYQITGWEAKKEYVYEWREDR